MRQLFSVVLCSVLAQQSMLSPLLSRKHLPKGFRMRNGSILLNHTENLT